MNWHIHIYTLFWQKESTRRHYSQAGKEHFMMYGEKKVGHLLKNLFILLNAG